MGRALTWKSRAAHSWPALLDRSPQMAEAWPSRHPPPRGESLLSTDKLGPLPRRPRGQQPCALYDRLAPPAFGAMLERKANWLAADVRAAVREGRFLR
jgi:hypothetical protein